MLHEHRYQLPLHQYLTCVSTDVLQRLNMHDRIQGQLLKASLSSQAGQVLECVGTLQPGDTYLASTV